MNMVTANRRVTASLQGCLMNDLRIHCSELIVLCVPEVCLRECFSEECVEEGYVDRDRARPTRQGHCHQQRIRYTTASPL